MTAHNSSLMTTTNDPIAITIATAFGHLAHMVSTKKRDAPRQRAQKSREDPTRENIKDPASNDEGIAGNAIEGMMDAAESVLDQVIVRDPRLDHDGGSEAGDRDSLRGSGEPGSSHDTHDEGRDGNDRVSNRGSANAGSNHDEANQGGTTYAEADKADQDKRSQAGQGEPAGSKHVKFDSPGGSQTKDNPTGQGDRGQTGEAENARSTHDYPNRAGNAKTGDTNKDTSADTDGNAKTADQRHGTNSNDISPKETLDNFGGLTDIVPEAVAKSAAIGSAAARVMNDIDGSEDGDRSSDDAHSRQDKSKGGEGSDKASKNSDSEVKNDRSQQEGGRAINGAPSAASGQSSPKSRVYVAGSQTAKERSGIEAAEKGQKQTGDGIEGQHENEFKSPSTKVVMKPITTGHSRETEEADSRKPVDLKEAEARAKSIIVVENKNQLRPLETSDVLSTKVREVVKLKEHEEVRKLVRVNRHKHEVQIVEQPIYDEVVKEEEQHHNKVLPIETIHDFDEHESGSRTRLDEETRDLGNDVTVDTDHSTAEIGTEQEVVQISHKHIVIQPVIYRTTREKARVHSIQPVYHRIDEAPVILPKKTLRAMSLADHLKKSDGETSPATKIEETKPVTIVDEVMRIVFGRSSEASGDDEYASATNSEGSRKGSAVRDRSGDNGSSDATEYVVSRKDTAGLETSVAGGLVSAIKNVVLPQGSGRSDEPVDDQSHPADRERSHRGSAPSQRSDDDGFGPVEDMIGSYGKASAVSEGSAKDEATSVFDALSSAASRIVSGKAFTGA